jgi:hypothetical protein
VPSPSHPEGFYWVRYSDPQLEAGALPRVFVAERFAHTWWEPGAADELDGRKVEPVSDRLEPPPFDLEGLPVKVSTLAWPSSPRVPRELTRPEATTGHSPGPKARRG